MNLASPYRILKTCTFYYILIWINLLDGQPLTSGAENQKNLTDCSSDFETNLQQCLDGLYFYKWQTDTIKFQTSRNIFKEILKRFFCRQYTNSLQCVHEILDSCKQNETEQTVRKYLRQPWAHQYNTFCDINQHNSSFLVRNHSLETPQETSSKQISNVVKEDWQSTSSKQKLNSLQFSTIKSLQNSTSDIKRPMKLREQITYSNTNDNQFITGKLGNQLRAELAGNSKRIFSKNTLFFLKSAKTNNKIFQDKEVTTADYKNLVRKVESMTMKFFSQNAAVINNQSGKTISNSQYEVQFEIH